MVFDNVVLRLGLGRVVPGAGFPVKWLAVSYQREDGMGQLALLCIESLRAPQAIGQD